MELDKIMAAYLGDGHSALYPMSTARVEFPGLLPVRFYNFADGLFVVSAQPAHEDLVGARLVAVDGHPAGEVLQRIAAVVPRDNEQGVDWIGPFYMMSPAALRAVGMAASLETVALTVEDAAGRRDVTLETGPHFDFDTRVPPAPGGTPPRWLARMNENLWRETLPEGDSVYLQFNKARDPDSGPTLAALAHSLRAGMTARGTRTLIVDVRHNNGGGRSREPSASGHPRPGPDGARADGLP